MRIEFDAKSVNEGFARVSAAAFVTQLDPTLDEGPYNTPDQTHIIRNQLVPRLFIPCVCLLNKSLEAMEANEEVASIYQPVYQSDDSEIYLVDQVCGMGPSKASTNRLTER